MMCRLHTSQYLINKYRMVIIMGNIGMGLMGRSRKTMHVPSTEKETVRKESVKRSGLNMAG